MCVFVCKQKTAYEMRISDWSSDVCSSDLIGHNWVKYTFRVNSPNIDQEALKDGIRDFTSFWAHKNGISLHNAIFEIRVKKNLQPTKWEIGRASCRERVCQYV